MEIWGIQRAGEDCAWTGMGTVISSFDTSERTDGAPIVGMYWVRWDFIENKLMMVKHVDMGSKNIEKDPEKP